MLGLSMFAAFAIAALSPAAVAPPVAPPTLSATESAQRQAAGLRLSNMLYPVELQVGMAKKVLRQQFVPALLKDPAIQALEEKYPGVLDAVAVDLEPVFVRWVTDEMPSYHKAIGDLYAKEFSVAELTEIYAFFSTPTGRKLSQGVQMKQEFEGVLTEAVRHPDGQTTIATIESDKRAAVNKTINLMNDNDLPELRRLSNAPWFSKLKAFRAKVLTFEADYMNSPSPKLESELERVMTATMQRFIASGDHKTTS